ncbi:MAG: AMP-binding protein [Rhizobiaceae bacterium]|nr:AMP-binding protein [Rhizobiaceae bacterium]
MSVAPVPHQGPTIRSLLDGIADECPDQAHLIDPITGETLTYRQTRERAVAVAKVIANKGRMPGEPVAYAFSNSIDGAITILGILYGGYLATAINLVAGSSTIEYVLEHSEANLVIADEEAKGLVEACTSSLENPPVILDLEQFSVAPNTDGLLAEPEADFDGLLMYTSGTTGRPKGVLHTQSSLLSGGENTAQAHQLSSKDRGLCVLPFYHINAFCVSLMGSLVSAGSLVIPPRFSVSSFWEVIWETQCTWFSVVPTQISYLLHNTELPSGDGTGTNYLRFGRSASAPLSPDMHSAFEKRFGIPIIETMGLTETAAQILSNPLPPAVRKIGSPGIAFGNEVMIGDADQIEVPRNEEGEILVRGPNLLREYLKNKEATAKAVTRSGWLKTGDLGRMDADGYVYVTGRLKELIIKGGENIAPREVDEALYSHPDVVEAAAFGVSCDDYGQRVEAGVKLSEGSATTAEDLLEICREKLGAFKCPDRIHLLPELPKGPSGKIQRIHLAGILS